MSEEIASSDKPVAGLRVGVKNGGCAGMSYTMEFAEAVAPHDEIIEDKGVRDPDRSQSGAVFARHAHGFQDRRLSSGFVVRQSERDLGLRLRRRSRSRRRAPRLCRSQTERGERWTPRG